MNTEYYLWDPKQPEQPYAKMVRKGIVMLTQGEVVDTLHSATSAINSLLRQIEEHLRLYTQAGSSILRNALRGDLDMFNRHSTLFVYNDDQFNSFSLQQVEKLQELLWIFRSANEAALARATEGKPLVSGKIYFQENQLQVVIRPHPFQRSNGKPIATIFEVQFLSGYVCAKCGHAIAEEDRRYHIAHPGCSIKIAIKEAVKSSLEKVPFDVGLAAREAGVTTSLIPIKHDIWVEKWVVEAARLYHHNPGGYAGLTLAEFLAKSKPELAAQAVQEETT